MAATNEPKNGNSGITRLDSPFPFTETVQRLSNALATHGIKIFATWDQQAEAAAAGLTMPPTTLIVFGNPKAGTPLMVAQPQSALDLPLKVLVTEVDGNVSVYFNTPQYILERHALSPTLLANLAPAFALIERALQR